ncbi:MAG: hypothetical protein AB1Z98_26725 [Nannocystaceae bacterium]
MNARVRAEVPVVPVGARAVSCHLDEDIGDDGIGALIERLEDALERGRDTIFIDMSRATNEPAGVRIALAQWGKRHSSRLARLHVLAGSPSSHVRMTITSIVLGPWLVSHLEHRSFADALAAACIDPEEGSIACFEEPRERLLRDGAVMCH